MTLFQLVLTCITKHLMKDQSVGLNGNQIINWCDILDTLNTSLICATNTECRDKTKEVGWNVVNLNVCV